ncbi:hypothetical protein GMORB2_6136 [Geosmithia morbida]|uniref:Uncharacterized protein n=1 Tax=Geosmithia morbida TaxID=1094350 RepID=A0A9P4YV78_9HYPO|nr:uncharacterized protein GMORB2_6136 [Geosmithia morbida]KAF4123435.1 hypothetical protein GMORB2_6136 [Geosmithia morbida]
MGGPLVSFSSVSIFCLRPEGEAQDGEAQDGEVQEGEVREGEVEEEEEDMYAEPDTAVADEESLAYIRFYFGLDESTTREEVLRYLEANTSILAHIALDTRPHNLRHILERSPLRMRVGSRAYTENGELLIDSIRNIDWGSRLLDDFVDSVRRGGRSSLDRWDKSRRGRASLAAAPPTSSSLQARRRNQASLGRVRLSTRISSLMSRSGTTRGGRKVAYLRWPGWRAPTEPHPGDGLPPSADLDPPRASSSFWRSSSSRRSPSLGRCSPLGRASPSKRYSTPARPAQSIRYTSSSDQPPPSVRRPPSSRWPLFIWGSPSDRTSPSFRAPHFRTFSSDLSPSSWAAFSRSSPSGCDSPSVRSSPSNRASTLDRSSPLGRRDTSSNWTRSNRPSPSRWDPAFDRSSPFDRDTPRDRIPSSRSSSERA